MATIRDNSAWNLFHEGFTNIINKYAPLKKYRVKGRNNAWFSPDLANILHERNVAWAKARKSNQNSDWLVFRQLRNACTLKIRKAKADHFLSQTTHNLNNPSKFWKTIKSLSENSKGQELPSSIVIDSQKLTDKTKILDCFNEHFIASGFLFESLNTQHECSSTVETVGLDPSSQSFSFSPITVSDVNKALKHLDKTKSAGPDKLDPYFLKLAANFIAVPLTNIFNLCLNTNVIPSLWKSAFVVPLLKGGDPSIINNYRPISKLSVLVKVLESLVSDQLKDFFNNKNVLSDFQSGFRKMHSTTSAALKVLNDFIESIDNKQHCAALFIDLSKAFDTVDHTVLKHRLCRAGLSEQTVSWFDNYLTDRTQCVQAEGNTSRYLKITKGVPQGSVLGPLLFILYINNIDSNVSKGKFHFYADDTVLYCSAPTADQALSQLQLDFKTLQQNLYDLKLFSNLKFKSNLPSILTSQGTKIECVSKYRYLGILID